MTYRAKTCPYCGTEHKKRGPFCSKSCSNRNRTLTDTTKAKISHSQSAKHATPERKDSNWHVMTRGQLEKKARESMLPEEQMTNPEDIYLPPMTSDQPDGTFVAGGDLWFEKD